MKIYLLRHSKTKENENYHIQGRADNRLSPLGIKEAHLMGSMLKKLNIPFDAFYSSPLLRAQETMNIVLEELGIKAEYKIVDGLIEREFGSIEGESLSTAIYDRIKAETVDGLEKRVDIVGRTRSAIDYIINESMDKENILIVTHAHVIKSIMMSIDDSLSYDLKLENLSLSLLEYKDNKLVISYYNRKLVN